ncbi:hypothetical protein HanIR_Chr16g0795191 [Helianthus annuus]|nr:hypothetical protein HanIR_Chr16g0795191 [Helianthus annuus]
MLYYIHTHLDTIELLTRIDHYYNDLIQPSKHKETGKTHLNHLDQTHQPNPNSVTTMVKTVLISLEKAREPRA